MVVQLRVLHRLFLVNARNTRHLLAVLLPVLVHHPHRPLVRTRKPLEDVDHLQLTIVPKHLTLHHTQLVLTRQRRRSQHVLWRILIPHLKLLLLQILVPIADIQLNHLSSQLTQILNILPFHWLLLHDVQRLHTLLVIKFESLFEVITLKLQVYPFQNLQNRVILLQVIFSSRRSHILKVIFQV